MYIDNHTIHFAATDVSSHVNCPYLTQLKLKVDKGELQKPVYDSISLETLRKKGQEFENEYLAELKAQGFNVVEIDREDKYAEALTQKAMQDGVDYIYQARLKQGIYYGWADFLKKTNKPSSLGQWSYEVIDTKLARETKAGSVLQICFYSQIIQQIQGVLPEYMYIKTPDQLEPYRVDDFMAYFRLVQSRLTMAVANPQPVYPEPVPHCEVCDWWDHCNKRRRDDDHLSFVAGMGSAQIREVRSWDINTLEAMAEHPLPIKHKPSRGSVETYTKLREQARVQLQSRREKRPVHEILPLQPGFGFYQLPAPSEGDVSLDFEGDPFIEPEGLEYLFGWVFQGGYAHIWALTAQEEKKAFEDFVDCIMAIRERYPDMHIYHFSPYEPAALKRLMGKYATRETEIDIMLRAGLFVDLHSIVKQSIRAGVESYSLKELEKYHGFTRKQELRELGKEKMAFECLLESGFADEATEKMKDVVRDYNVDDCRSTFHLQSWLEKLRTDLIANGELIPRPELKTGEAGPKVTAFQERIQPIYDRLMNGLPFDRSERNDAQQANWLLANMLDWYRRENKPFWWEYFRLKQLPVDELLDEKDAIAGLRYTGQRTLVKRSVVDRYYFPPQETDIGIGASLSMQDGTIVGEVFDINVEQGYLDIKRGNGKANLHPDAVIHLENFKSEKKEEAIIRLADWVANHGISAKGKYKAGRELLLRALPQTKGHFVIDNDPQGTAVNWVKVLNNSVLPIQGPPGAGKSHTAASMILELVKQGKTIGITALSHKVIHALMKKVQEMAQKKKMKISMVQKPGEVGGHCMWIEAGTNEEVLSLLKSGEVQVAGGTPFLWSRPDFADAVDVMFVDEAGQLSLIDTLALSHSAHSLVLLGDPQQLKQPQKGTHSAGTELSALEHILQDTKTIQTEQGVFLDLTWRLHSRICAFNSELFYEGRLKSKTDNDVQRIEGNAAYPEPGLYYEAVDHLGNKNSSEDEVERVKEIIGRLLKPKTVWVDKDGSRRKLTKEDIMVIAPYNAQVNALAAALPDIRVGTVDKFQGQEASAVIFSMATSSPEDAPRGMDFLYSLNRLNVAVSRAKVLFILIANIRLFEPDCKSPAQMKLANALCRLREFSDTPQMTIVMSNIVL
jgi:predicted RecB family nuclease